MTASNVQQGLAELQGDIDGLGTAATQDVGTGAFDVVQLDADGLLPAVGGGNLINITSSQIGGLGSAAGLDAGTAGSNVVQLDPDGSLPILDGSALTNLDWDNLINLPPGFF